jgi:hypothetical protein
MMAHSYKPNTQEIEVGRFQLAWALVRTFSQNKNKNNSNKNKIKTNQKE